MNLTKKVKKPLDEQKANVYPLQYETRGIVPMTIRISGAPRASQPCYVYLASGPASSLVKVGMTSNPRLRLGQMQIGRADPIETRLVMEFEDREAALLAEKAIQSKLKQAGRHERGEWFRIRDWEVDLIAETYRDCGFHRVLTMTMADLSEAA